MSETIWRATDLDGKCFQFLRHKPEWNGKEFGCGYGDGASAYKGTDKPPAGECWEMTVTRRGDIDTDGEPIGWKIVGIGKDGSVLCEKPNGQRRRYSFGDWAKEQPSGEAWEKLLNVVADYSRNVGLVGPHGEKVKEAWKAYEAAQSAESKFGECETCGVGQHLPSGACDHCGTKKQEDDPQLAKLLKACRNAYNAGPGARRVLLGSVLHEWAKIDLPSQSAEPSDQQATIEVLTKELSISDQVIDERNATIAELRSELDETRTESHAYKSRLREFCQRLVDMVGAEGPEDVQGMLDKVNAEINRLKQSIDSLSANLADKEGFLNSAGDEIEVLTKERDEALRELANERSSGWQVNDELRRTIAELQAKLAKPGMPEVVLELLEIGRHVLHKEWRAAMQAVRDYYAPPFKITRPGVYETEDGNPWEVIYIDPKGGVVARHETTKLLENFHVSGSCKGGNFSLTKYLRPLE